MGRSLLTRPAVRWIGAMIAVLLIIGTTGGMSVRDAISDNERVGESYGALQALSELRSRLQELESADRAYALTRRAEYLDSSKRAGPLLAAALDEAERYLRADPALRDRAGVLRERMENRIALSRHVVALAPDRSFVAGTDGPLLERMRHATADANELALLAQGGVRLALDNRLAAVGAGLTRTLSVGALLLAAVFALAFALTYFFRREMRRRGDLERQMQEVNADLTATVQELQQLSREKNQIAAMVDLLQSCRTAEEAYAVISRSLARLMPESSGAIGAVKAASSLVELVLTWGANPPTQAVFASDDCWALRRGRAHAEYDSATDVRCNHILPDATGASLCLPLIAQGEALGVLYLNLPDGEVLSDDIADLTLTLSEQISMALANLRLQEMLRMQSILDPLSGVFNRRYMESTLERELLRAKRGGRPLAITMIDVDHFKQFNDRFGHDAGDALLRAFGGLLKSIIRGDDVACRYGGEEFVLIMPGAPESIASERAAQLRAALAGLEIQHHGHALGPVTISCGIAVFPGHGASAENLLEAADAALYEAKRAGRDRVLVARSLRLAAVSNQ